MGEIEIKVDVDLKILDYSFLHKPLLIGGKAMEYYGLRKAGLDIDLVIHNEDHIILKNKYPNIIKIWRWLSKWYWIRHMEKYDEKYVYAEKE